MALSPNQISTIHVRRSAISGKKYFSDTGKVYIGNSNGTLRLLDEANITTFKPTLTLKEKDIQKIIEFIDSSINTIIINTQVKETEIDFGSSNYQKSRKFSIFDNNSIIGKNIVASLSYEAPTNRSQDETEMVDFFIRGKANLGSIDLFVTSLTGSIKGKYKINYLIN